MKQLRTLFYLLYSPFNRLRLWIYKVKHGNIAINGLLFVLNKGQMMIGNNAKINSSKYKNIIGGDTRSSIVVKRGASLIIGENLKMSNSAIFCTHRITIGNNVMIGGSCRIWDTDFHPVDPAMRFSAPNENYKSAPINIGDNVFIGGFSIILKGVTIGDNAVIGAGSVVSRSIPANEIWGGNPARFIKKLEIHEQTI